MAPSFFSKLVKTGPNVTVSPPQRDQTANPMSMSTSSLSSSSVPPRSRTVSVIDTSSSKRTSEFGQLGAGAGKQRSRPPSSNSRVVSGGSKGENGHGDRGYQSDSSANPSVNIVPPSPMVSDGSPQISGLPDIRNGNSASAGVDGLPQAVPTMAQSSSAASNSNGNGNTNSKRSRPTTPASSPPQNNASPQTLQAPNEMGRKASSKSLRSIFTGNNNTTASPPQKNANNNPKGDSLDSTNSNASSGNHGLVESPTSMETEFVFTTPEGQGQGQEDLTPRPTAPEPVSPNSLHQRSKSAGNSPPSQSPAHRKEATVGVFGQPARSGTGWRKNSTKPTGLAGAIAASGLAMANPGLTGMGIQQPQMSPPLPRGQMNRPNTGTHSHPDDQPPLPHSSPNQNQNQNQKRKKEKKRNSTYSDPHNLPAPNLGDHDYYSGLESGSEDSDEEFGDDSEDDEILGRRGRGRSEGGGSTGVGGGGSTRGGGGESRSRTRAGLGSGESLPYGQGGPGGGSNEGGWGGGGSHMGGGGGMGMGGGQDWGVTGFAVASSRRNTEFHELFPGIPEGDYLIEDYGCALQREILIQGRLYISENHICFHANILGWITDLSIPIYEITALEKKMTAFVIPNAIQITTRRAKYSFASFLARDTTFDVIYNIWRLARPVDVQEVGVAGREIGEQGVAAAGSSAASVGAAAASGGGAAAAAAAGPKKTICECSKKGEHFTETALDAILPGTPDRIHNLMFASGFMKEFMVNEQKLLDIQMSDWTPTSPTAPQGLLARNMSYIKPLSGPVGPKQTKCEIRDEIVHCDFDDYVSTVSTTRTPDVPSGGVFSVKTRTCVMWASVASSRVIVSTQVEWTGRSFIKGIIERATIDGQKTQYTELDRAMRAYIKEHQTEFIPEGVDLSASTAAAAAAEAQELEVTTDPTGGDVPPTPKERERERNQRAFQWAWDTFAGAAQVGKTSAKGAIELIKDAWDQSETTTVLYFVIVGLVLSNLWTWWTGSSSSGVGEGGLGKRELRELRELRRELRERDMGLQEMVPPAKGGEEGERERWIQGIVSALKEEMKPPAAPTASPVVVDADGKVVREHLEETVAGLMKTLDEVEERAKALRQSLQRASVEELD